MQPAANTPSISVPTTAVSSKAPSVCDPKKGGLFSAESQPALDSSPALSPSKEVASDVESHAIRPGSRLDRIMEWLLVPLLCCAQFFDIFTSSSALVALPEIGAKLDISPGTLQWVVSAYTLTFASFQLVGGRLSDIYHPKPVFCAGFALVGVFSVLCAVSTHPIMLIVFRAVQGIGAAFTLPSAISLIVQGYPDPHEQAQALAAFGAFGAVGNVVGFVLGGVLTSRVGWRWVFYLVTILVIPLSALSVLVIPSSESSELNKKRKVDVPGVFVLTGGLVLFVYAISDANHVGWGRPQILVTLILSVICIVGFFLIEHVVPDPAVPASTWTNENFLPLFIYCLSVYWFLTGSELQLVQVFQDLFGWSALKASIHFIPIGVAGGTTAFLTGRFGHIVPRRVLLLMGQVLIAIGCILFALADTPDKYWSHVLPGMIVSMTGLASGYVGANMTIMAGARKGEEGVVGALMNTSFQLGATIGIAVMTAISLGVNSRLPIDPVSQFTGYAASFWSLVGLHGLMLLLVVVLVK